MNDNDKLDLAEVKEKLRIDDARMLNLVIQHYDDTSMALNAAGKYLNDQGAAFLIGVLELGVSRANRDASLWNADKTAFIRWETEMNIRESGLFQVYRKSNKAIAENVMDTVAPQLRKMDNGVGSAILLLGVKHLELRNLEVNELEEQFKLEVNTDMTTKEAVCPECGTDLEDPDMMGIPGGSAIVGDHWCPSCEEGYETYELKDVTVEEPKDEKDQDVNGGGFGKI